MLINLYLDCEGRPFTILDNKVVFLKEGLPFSACCQAMALLTVVTGKTLTMEDAEKEGPVTNKGEVEWP